MSPIHPLFAERHLAEVKRLADADRRRRGTLVDAIERCRAEGVSWGELGEAFGTSRQAVHQRYFRAMRRREDCDG